MSEQVGASLVLAQMLMPGQASPGSQDTTASGLLNGAGSGLQAIDSIDENSPAFASLLTELKNLEARAPAPDGLNAEALIRIRVTTQSETTVQSPVAAGQQAPGTGTEMPGTGKRLPGSASLPSELTDPTQAASPLPADTDLLNAVEIVVPEPGSTGDAQTTAGPEERLPDLAAALTAGDKPTPGSPPAANSAVPVPTGSAAAGPPAATPTANPDPAARAIDVQPQPAAAAGVASAVTAEGSESGDSAAGGEQQGHRQAQANSSSRGPTISFSLEGLPSATLAAPGTAGSASAGQSVLTQPLTLLGQPAQWAEPLAERLAGLATRGANTAEIRLHPPSLGQLEVRITLSNDQASLFVASANPEVREALQQALPRLDNLLNGFGIELAESEIAERQADAFQGEERNHSGAKARSGGEQAEQLQEKPVGKALGLLDTWA